MFRKFLFAYVFGALLFNYSYSMDKADSAETPQVAVLIDSSNPLDLVNMLAVGQCYKDLDTKIREYSAEKTLPGIYDLIKDYADKRGDVCMIYHMCKRDDIIATTPGVMLEKNDLDLMQKRFVYLLIRVYSDVSACISIGQKHEEVYNLFRDKVRDVWYYNIGHHISDFGILARSALGHASKLQPDLAPSPIWVCYCSGSGWSSVGLYSHTVYFQNVDNHHDLEYKNNLKRIRDSKKAAIKKISDRLNTIASTSDLSEQKKWEVFLTLDYKDI